MMVYVECRLSYELLATAALLPETLLLVFKGLEDDASLAHDQNQIPIIHPVVGYFGEEFLVII
jgi:hypothetical protein